MKEFITTQVLRAVANGLDTAPLIAPTVGRTPRNINAVLYKLKLKGRIHLTGATRPANNRGRRAVCYAIGRQHN